jgi:hypothetical protein
MIANAVFKVKLEASFILITLATVSFISLKESMSWRMQSPKDLVSPSDIITLRR